LRLLALVFKARDGTARYLKTSIADDWQSSLGNCGASERRQNLRKLAAKCLIGVMAIEGADSFVQFVGEECENQAGINLS